MDETAAAPATIAVTGTGGGLGAVIARGLAGAGCRIVALASDVSRARPFAAELRPLPSPAAAEADFHAALAGAGAVVHAAGLSNENPRTAREDYFSVNADLTERLARAAAATVPGGFFHISSIRALAGPLFDGTLTDTMAAQPACDYGRSKREGELRALRAFADAGRRDCRVLRLPPVYGRTLAGNLRLLYRLAATPWPLPLAGLASRRSLVSAESVAAVVAWLLERPGLALDPCLVSDRRAVTIAEIVTALRTGLGRRPRLFAVPDAVLALGARLAGKADLWQRLNCEQVCDGEILAAAGWGTAADSLAGLAEAARSAEANESGAERGKAGT